MALILASQWMVFLSLGSWRFLALMYDQMPLMASLRVSSDGPPQMDCRAADSFRGCLLIPWFSPFSPPPFTWPLAFLAFLPPPSARSLTTILTFLLVLTLSRFSLAADRAAFFTFLLLELWSSFLAFLLPSFSLADLSEFLTESLGRWVAGALAAGFVTAVAAAAASLGLMTAGLPPP